jgi:two-component system LytT family response regulator
VKLITNNKSFVILSTMKAFENELPKGLFLRIHKSYIVNLKKVERYDSKYVEIEKMKLPLSRTRKTQLSQALDVIIN